MKKIIKHNLINICLLSFLELIFGLMMFDIFNRETIISNFIHILFLSFCITLFTTIFSKKINRILNYIFYFFICLIFAFQFVMKSSMDSFMSLSMFSLTDQAVDFLGEAFKIIFSNLHGIIICFLPFIFLIVFRKKFDFYMEKKDKLYLLSYIILIPLSFCSYRLYLSTKKDTNLSIYDLYYNINNNNLNIQKLGVLPSFELDVYRTIFGFKDKIIKVNFEENNTSEDIFIYDKNVLDLEFDDNLDNNVISYIENNPGTSKNKYTGIFKDKNLIFIVAESFSTVGVRENLTPTLYKLTNNGFVFNNYYVPYYLSTIGGEFQADTALYPDTSTLSIWRNGKNSFPYGLANSFKNANYNTYAYHNHSGYFQDRYKYLKAIGFDNFKACYMGLDINCDVWPESDTQMMEKTYTDYINSDKPFLAYYMTVSGHMEYNYGGNYIASKNKSLVDNLDLSDTSSAYLATQIELDKALEFLINKLEENNKLDDTIIVLTADHYPYALSLDEMNELSNYKRDNLFEINHNSLIIWNSKLNRKEIDKVGMSIDVLPTVYNLFGIDYDSRIFAGSDLLSDSEGLVILGNRSWITDKGRYNSITNEYIGTGNKEYINNINNIVQNKIAFSKNIMIDDGYRYIKENK